MLLCKRTIAALKADKGLRKSFQLDGSGAAGSRIMAYAGAVSSAGFIKTYGGSQLVPMRIAANGSLRAGMFRNNAGSMYVKFSNNGGASYGTELQIDSVVSGSGYQNWDIKILSATLAVISYFNGSHYPCIVPITLSGTTGTLGSEYQLVTSGSSDWRYNINMAVMSATRIGVSYSNASGYPTVLGVSFSGSTPTKDAAATVWQSTAIANSGTGSRQKIDIAFTFAGKAVGAWVNSAQALAQYCELTDSGTAWSVAAGPSNGAGNYSAGNLAVFATPTAFLIVYSQDSSMGLALTAGALASGVIGTVARATSGDPKLKLIIDNADMALEPNYAWQGCAIGNTDGDGVQWFLVPATMASGKLRIALVGIDPTAPVRLRQRAYVQSGWMPNADSPNNPPVFARVDDYNVYCMNRNQDDPTSDIKTQTLNF